MSDVEYLVCKNCDTPCYVFELGAKDAVASAYCQVCGNDDVDLFLVPDVEDMEPEE